MEAILRVYNAQGRRDNIYKARIKILVQALGAAKFTELVEAEFSAMPRERFRLPHEVVEAIRARFGAPSFARLPTRSQSFEAAIRDDAAFARWARTNTHAHREPGYVSAVISLKPIGGIPGDASAEQRTWSRTSPTAIPSAKSGWRTNRTSCCRTSASTKCRRSGGAGRGWSGGREHRPHHRHNRLSGSRLLRPGQCPLHSDRPDDQQTFRGSSVADRDRRTAHQYIRLHQRLRPSPCRAHRHPRRR